MGNVNYFKIRFLFLRMDVNLPVTYTLQGKTLGYTYK